MLELLLSFTVVTVTALGGALGTVRGGRQRSCHFMNIKTRHGDQSTSEHKQCKVKKQGKNQGEDI